MIQFLTKLIHKIVIVLNFITNPVFFFKCSLKTILNWNLKNGMNLSHPRIETTSSGTATSRISKAEFHPDRQTFSNKPHANRTPTKERKEKHTYPLQSNHCHALFDQKTPLFLITPKTPSKLKLHKNCLIESRHQEA